ncbi:hypothetical protein D3C76_701230 [compost metagenome]
MHQYGVARVPVRVEIGQALGGQAQVDLDISNHEAPFVGGTLQFQRQQAAKGRAGAVRRYYPVSLQLIATGWGIDAQPGEVVMLRQAGYAVAPAQFHQRVGLDGLDQKLLQAGLLQVGHGRVAVVWVVWAFHTEHPLVAVERIATAPRQAKLADPLGDAYLLQDFQRAAGEHDRPATLAHLPFRRQYHAGYAMTGKVQGSGQADRAGAYHHYRFAFNAGGPDAGRMGGEDLIVEIEGATRLAVGLMHAVHILIFVAFQVCT